MIGSLPTRTLPLHAPRGPSFRRLLAAMLRAASRSLARLSRSLSAAERARERTQGAQVFEFYAEAGAPEGALYLNGELIGYLPGVTRL
jgi:hypothetical protein